LKKITEALLVSKDKAVEVDTEITSHVFITHKCNAAQNHNIKIALKIQQNSNTWV
jgi:hypothetical protein